MKEGTVRDVSEKLAEKGPKAPRLLGVFRGEVLSPPPMWLMRQAGRYLPEYREVRRKAGSFLDLCYNPELAAEVTLQPIRRYGFDAAILFSDILVVPDALGQKVAFVEGEGPHLDPLTSGTAIARLSTDGTARVFDTICETVSRVRAALPAETALIGFAGAPWTVATYMIGGRGSPDQAAARLMAYRDEASFAALIRILIEATVDYLGRQIRAGANIVQLFDSWAGNLADDQLERWVVAPTAEIVRRLKTDSPAVPIIGFPRGAGPSAPRYVAATKVDGVGCDTAMPLGFIRDQLASRAVVQGNLDPLLLVAGGERLERRVREILAALAPHPFIFNLGHGIVPETPPEHVARLVEIVRSGAA